MAHSRQSPQDDRYIMVLLGRKQRLKEVMVKGMLSSEEVQVSEEVQFSGRFCTVAESRDFTVVVVPDDFDERNLSFDHHVIDIMAMSLPGPHLFVLAVDQENAEAPRIQEEVQLLQKTFGDTVVRSLVVTLPDIESFHNVKHLKDSLHVFTMVIVNENLAQMCRQWCQDQERFKFTYRSYSKEVIQRRRQVLSESRYMGLPPDDRLSGPKAPPKTQHRETTIVLLGLTGTGKSASCNTLLAAARSRSRFRSVSSSEPVTRVCETETVELGGARLRLVDTPDLFQEDSQKAVEEVKSYLAPGPFVVLLTIKVNRVTDQEKHLLQEVQQRLGLRIQEKTVLLLTAAEELKEQPLLDFIKANKDLAAIALSCEYRVASFKNKKKTSSKQVPRLLDLLKVMGVSFSKKLLPDVTVKQK